MLVKTSSTLGEDIGKVNSFVNEEMDLSETIEENELMAIPAFKAVDAQEQFSSLSEDMERLTSDLIDNELASFENIFQALLLDINKVAVHHLNIDTSEMKDTQWHLLKESNDRTDLFREEDIPFMKDRLALFGNKILEFPNQAISKLNPDIFIDKQKRAYRKPVKIYLKNRFLEYAMQNQLRIGAATAILTDVLKEGLIESEKAFSILGDESVDNRELLDKSFKETSKKINEVCNRLRQSIKNSGREMLANLIGHLQDEQTEKEANIRLSRKKRKALLEDIKDFPQHWLKITDLLCSKMATDIKLHGVQLVIEQVGEQVSQELDTSMIAVTKRRLDMVELWLSDLIDVAIFDHNDAPQVDQSLAYDDIRIQGLLSWAETAGQELPEQLELMKSDGLNEISFHQGDEVEVLTIDSRSSFIHLLTEVLHRPIRKLQTHSYVENMEILSKLQYDINNITQKVGLQKDAPKPDEIKNLAIKAKENLLSLGERFDSQNVKMVQHISDMIHSANSAMNASSLLDYAVRVIPKVTANSSGESLKNWYDLASERTSTFIAQLNNLSSSSSNAQSLKQSAQSASQTRMNMHETLRAYTDALRVSDKVFEQVPFYYRQLFVGRQAANVDGLRHREKELERALNILSPKYGDGSSLIVLGAPLSGKSFFAESLAKAISIERVVKINPPISGSTSIIDLKRTLEKLSGNNDSGRSIFKSVEAGTIFLFEDIELWWSRGDAKNMAIKHLVDLVNNADLKGRIILTCNPYAFKLMEDQGLLADLTLPRISMLPMDRSALKEILLERHMAGGLTLSLKGKSEDGLSKKELRKMIDRNHETSAGLIGVALYQWLNNIVSYQDEKISISFPTVLPFPEIMDKEWLVLIGQFIIHKHLDAQRVQKLFKYRDMDKAERMISQLHADGVLEDVLGSTFRLSPLVQTAFIKKAESWGLI